MTVDVSTGRDVIPRTFHRVWVGGSMPEELAGLGESWLRHNTGWEMRVWTEANLPPLRNQALYDAAPSLVESRLLGRFRANLIRLEVLEQFGGVYVDCDFEALAAIPDRYLSASCFVARETPAFVNNGIIGATPGHPYITSIIDAIPESVRSQPGKPSNVTTGPHLLTRLLTGDVAVIPTAEVYPYSWRDALNEKPVSTEGAWAHHLWAGSRWQVSVIVPFRGGCPHRERSAEFVVNRLRLEHPDWQVTLVDSPSERFSRSQAALRGLEMSFGKIIVVHDSDSWVPGLDAAVAAVKADAAWAMPHLKVHRLTAESSDRFMSGEQANLDDCVELPYKGTLAGGVVVLRRETLEACPPDPRFQGWGGEDVAWSTVLQAKAGAPKRMTDPLIHLWHPTPQRLTRAVGNIHNDALLKRYLSASRQNGGIDRLVTEARLSWSSGSHSLNPASGTIRVMIVDDLKAAGVNVVTGRHLGGRTTGVKSVDVNLTGTDPSQDGVRDLEAVVKPSKAAFYIQRNGKLWVLADGPLTADKETAVVFVAAQTQAEVNQHQQVALEKLLNVLEAAYGLGESLADAVDRSDDSDDQIPDEPDWELMSETF